MMELSDDRKRAIFAGVIIGTVGVGLFLLARKTPRDQWGDTLGRIAKDALGLVKSRYGDSEPIRIAERTLDKIREEGSKPTAISQAFQDAVAHRPHTI